MSTSEHKLTRPYRIAVVLEHEVTVGGTFQHSVSLLETFFSYPTNEWDVQVLCLKAARHPLLDAHASRVHYRARHWSLRFQLAVSLHLQCAWLWKWLNPFRRELSRFTPDLVFFLNASPLAVTITDQPFAMVSYDTCHRDEPEFPEVREQGEFARREKINRHMLPMASLILVDSEESRQNLIARYGIDESRILPVTYRPAPHFSEAKNPSPATDVMGRYRIEAPYVYYPAQFWAHKNHVYLLKGIATLKAKGHQVQAVFSGTDYGNETYIRETARTLGLASQVKFLGFVDDDEVRALYANALALVMPTYFGPCNIPPLEAFYMGIPVLYPDLPGLRAQVGDAALLMDLSSPESMADHIIRLLTEPALRAALVHKGRARLKQLQEIHPAAAILPKLETLRQRRLCWRTDHSV